MNLHLLMHTSSSLWLCWHKQNLVSLQSAHIRKTINHSILISTCLSASVSKREKSCSNARVFGIFNMQFQEATQTMTTHYGDIHFEPLWYRVPLPTVPFPENCCEEAYCAPNTQTASTLERRDCSFRVSLQEQQQEEQEDEDTTSDVV